MYINDSVSQSLQAGFPLVCGGTEGIAPLPKKLTGPLYPTPQQFCPKNVDFVIIVLFFCHFTQIVTQQADPIWETLARWLLFYSGLKKSTPQK